MFNIFKKKVEQKEEKKEGPKELFVVSMSSLMGTVTHTSYRFSDYAVTNMYCHVTNSYNILDNRYKAIVKNTLKAFDLLETHNTEEELARLLYQNIQAAESVEAERVKIMKSHLKVQEIKDGLGL